MTDIVVHDHSGHPCQVQLSRALAGLGHHVVHQYCGSYVTGRGALERRPQDPDGFEVEDVSLGRSFRRYSPVARVREEITYGRLAARAIVRHRPAVVVLSNLPLLTLVIVTVALRARRIPYVLWLQDIYSSAVASVLRRRLGRISALAIAVAERCERSAARHAAEVVGIGEDFRGKLRAWQVADAHVEIIPNWAALDEMPLTPSLNAWSQRHLPGQGPVALYAGNIGLKHDPGLLVELARSLPGTRVVVVSEGRGRQWLERAVAETGVSNLHLLDFQPYEELPAVLGSADVLLALLEPDAGAYSVPSKILNYLCAGRPVVAAMPGDNPVARAITGCGAGLVIDPQDTAGFAATVSEILSDPSTRAEMGRRARAYAEDNFDIDRIVARFDRVIGRAARSS